MIDKLGFCKFILLATIIGNSSCQKLGREAKRPNYRGKYVSTEEVAAKINGRSMVIGICKLSELDPIFFRLGQRLPAGYIALNEHSLISAIKPSGYPHNYISMSVIARVVFGELKEPCNQDALKAAKILSAYSDGEYAQGFDFYRKKWEKFYEKKF